MTTQQYEALCRLFIAEQLGLGVTEVRSGRVSSITRAGLHEYNHQIDLYWETWDFLTRHLNIANAKWRGRVAVSLADVLLLKQVQLQVGAHKAVLITNSSFSPQAQYAAEDEGIALLIVRPTFTDPTLPAIGPEQIQARLRERAERSGPLYTFQAVKKCLEPSAAGALLGSLDPTASKRSASPTSEGPRLPVQPATKDALPPYRAGPDGGKSGFYRTK